MYLVEIFLPLADNSGQPFDDAKFTGVRETLAARFGGVTAFTRVPAHGVSRNGANEVHDDIVVFEAMAETLDRDLWARYRRQLERDFAQDEILIRATTVERL
jgi:hypothetical protein